MKKVLFNWSGGKDSSYALHTLLREGSCEVTALFTSVNDRYGRVSMHGTREELLDLQAAALGIPHHKLRLPGDLAMEEYDRRMREALLPFRQQGVETCVFGDIFLEDLRAYREDRLAEVGMEALFPLWKRPTDRLARSFIEEGFRAVVSCVDGRRLDREYVGREYDEPFLADLPEGIDPCGENGEFHTFVYDGPIFGHPVPVIRGEVVERSYRLPEQRSGAGSGDDENLPPGHSASDRKVGEGPSVHWFIDLLPDAGGNPSQAT